MRTFGRGLRFVRGIGGTRGRRGRGRDQDARRVVFGKEGMVVLRKG